MAHNQGVASGPAAEMLLFVVAGFRRAAAFRERELPVN
jgi:hypothetical protein